MVLRRWGSCTQKFGFINGVDKCKLTTVLTSRGLRIPFQSILLPAAALEMPAICSPSQKFSLLVKKSQVFKANCSKNFVFNSMLTTDKCFSAIHLFVCCYYRQSDVITNSDAKNNTPCLSVVITANHFQGNKYPD